jgi:hypothetical protein
MSVVIGKPNLEATHVDSIGNKYAQIEGTWVIIDARSQRCGVYHEAEDIHNLTPITGTK